MTRKADQHSTSGPACCSEVIICLDQWNHFASENSIRVWVWISSVAKQDCFCFKSYGQIPDACSGIFFFCFSVRYHQSLSTQRRLSKFPIRKSFALFADQDSWYQQLPAVYFVACSSLFPLHWKKDEEAKWDTQLALPHSPPRWPHFLKSICNELLDVCFGGEGESRWFAISFIFSKVFGSFFKKSSCFQHWKLCCLLVEQASIQHEWF